MFSILKSLAPDSQMHTLQGYAMPFTWHMICMCWPASLPLCWSHLPINSQCVFSLKKGKGGKFRQTLVSLPFLRLAYQGSIYQIGLSKPCQTNTPVPCPFPKAQTLYLESTRSRNTDLEGSLAHIELEPWTTMVHPLVVTAG
jgi:hypothetical protein